MVVSLGFGRESFFFIKSLILNNSFMQQENTSKLEGQVDNFSTPHDDFDWSLDKHDTGAYSPEERAERDAFYDSADAHLDEIEEGKILLGKVAKVNDQDVLVDIGYKGDALISLNEFRDLPDIAEGDEIEVLVINREDKNGALRLSRRLAVLERAWERIKALHESGETVQGKIISKTKGGLIATIHGFDTFVPGSQIDVKPIIDYDQFVGKTMEFKVVKINEHIKNAVVSHKILIEHDMAAQHSEIMAKLERGQIIEGVVKNITNFGAFLDLGGLDGLLYITDISWGRVAHPSDLLSLDQKLNVVVLDFDENKKRISLGLKQLTPHPWESMPDYLVEGAKVKGKVVNIEEYGSFLEIIPGIEGLVHVSEITWDNVMIHSREFFKLGDEHEVVVMKINREEKKISLSIKRLLPDPWDQIEVKYPVNTRHKAVVKNLSPYNAFVDLEPGIGGVVHVSDLSWLKRIQSPAKFCKIGSTLDVVVLNIDKENRRLQLGHKQIEENPWNTLETIFPVGSVHEGTVIRKDEKGATVSMDYGIETFAPLKQLQTQEGRELELEEKASFVVTLFDAADRKIMVSHTRVWEEEKRAQKDQERKDRVQEAKDTQKAVRSIQSKVEKSTIGDLADFASLNEKISSEDNKSEDKT